MICIRNWVGKKQQGKALEKLYNILRGLTQGTFQLGINEKQKIRRKITSIQNSKMGPKVKNSLSDRMFSSEEEVRHVRDLYHEVCARNFQLSTKIESLKIEKKEC